MAKQPEIAADSAPSLRSALWLYFLVLLGTAWITISLGSNIEPLFVRFAVAVFVVLGFTFAACRLTRTSLTGLFGTMPQLITVVVAVLLGLALFFPAQWLSSMLELLYLNTVGALPLPFHQPTAIPPLGYLLQFGIIIPLCYGLLFWGYMRRAAEGTFNFRGAILVAILYGLYGMFMTDLASSAVPGFLIIGIISALLVYLTKSLWMGVAINVGYNLAFLYLQPGLANFLTTDILNPFSIRWLMAAVVPGFIAFILFQVIRFRTPAPAAVEPAPLKRMWQIPLLLIVVVYVVVIASELILRSQQPTRAPARLDNLTAFIVDSSGAAQK